MKALVRKVTIRLVIAAFLFFVFGSLWGLYISVRPPKILSSLTPRDLGLDYEEVSFQTEDGLKLRGWYIPSKKKSLKTLVLLHGYPADKGNILPATSFLQEDFNLLLFDFRYLGQSEGRYSTAGIDEVKDLLAAIGFLKNRGVQKVGVWGFSMGGAVALMGLKKAPEIQAVVSESSYASLSEMAPRLFRIPGLRHILGYLVEFWAKIILGIDIRSDSPLQSVRQTTVPILLIHSSADTVIPFRHAQLLREALADNPQAEFWFKEGYAHGQLGTEYQNRLRDFFDKNL